MPSFRDVEPYIKNPGYTMDVPITDLEKQLNMFVTEHQLQLEPDFQRGHVWDDPKQTAFVEHILRGGKGSHQIRFNHPGWMHGWEGDFVLVDGLQRITALLRFLRDEIPAFGHYFSEYDDIINPLLGLNFMVNDLKTREEVLQWYIEINEGGVVHSDEEIQRVKNLLVKEKE